MPQKPLYSKAPLLTLSHAFSGNGTIRSDESHLLTLYENLKNKTDSPALLEGLFMLSCILRNRPLEEPVAQRILYEIADTEDGSFRGSFSNQICIARAALALYDYNTDRAILRRIYNWVQYVEKEYSVLSQQDGFLFRPADLMELLIRFYYISGVKAVLRLCEQIRETAFDWTTVLHTLNRSTPFTSNQEDIREPNAIPSELAFADKEKIVNNGEMLADAVRYTLFAGIYSGNKQDITAGYTAWKHLLKNHHAICGGTTGNPFLSGSGGDQPIIAAVVSAWTEAFTSQMLLKKCEWAVEELNRIVYNALPDFINRYPIPEIRYINGFGISETESIAAEKQDLIYARLTRAAASAYKHMVSLTTRGIRINYLLPASMLLKLDNQRAVIHFHSDSISIKCDIPISSEIDFFVLPSKDTDILLQRSTKEQKILFHSDKTEHAVYLHTDASLSDGDCILVRQNDDTMVLQTHHQGVYILKNNRLMTYAVSEKTYSIAFSQILSEDDCCAEVIPINDWKIKNSQPADIPVLPVSQNSPIKVRLTPYDQTEQRVTMFPRINKNV